MLLLSRLACKAESRGRAQPTRAAHLRWLGRGALTKHRCLSTSVVLLKWSHAPLLQRSMAVHRAENKKPCSCGMQQRSSKTNAFTDKYTNTHAEWVTSFVRAFTGQGCCVRSVIHRTMALTVCRTAICVSTSYELKTSVEEFSTALTVLSYVLINSY